MHRSVIQSRILLVKVAAPLALSSCHSRTLASQWRLCTFSEIEMLRYSSGAVMRKGVRVYMQLIAERINYDFPVILQRAL